MSSAAAAHCSPAGAPPSQPPTQQRHARPRPLGRRLEPAAIHPTSHPDSCSLNQSDSQPATHAPNHFTTPLPVPTPQHTRLLSLSGTQVQDIMVGEGAAPLPGDLVSVHWSGYTKVSTGKLAGMAGRHGWLAWLAGRAGDYWQAG